VTTFVGFESDNETSALEPCENLVKRARREVYPSKLLHVLHEGIAVFIAARETGKNEHRGSGVASEAYQRVFRISHAPTISISDPLVKEVAPLIRSV
jgi:hypothetical protein